MKITIDPTIPDLTTEEQKAIRKRARKTTDNPEQAKADMLKAKEVVFSPQVIEQLKKMGMTPDELVAMMLKSTGASQ
jgi:hypothetical protein